MKPTLGTTMNEILDAFKRLAVANSGRYITEADIVGGNLRFCWQPAGKLGVVVGEIGLRDATDAEYNELEDAVELGQAQIYHTPLYVSGRVMTRTILHQATGNPLDPNSSAARQQRDRWARADALRQASARCVIQQVYRP